jgi:hypothetical protein
MNLSIYLWQFWVKGEGTTPFGVDGIAGQCTRGSPSERDNPWLWGAIPLGLANKSARKEHSIWFKGGEQVRREHGTFHEPHTRPPLTLTLSPPRGEGTRWPAMLGDLIGSIGATRATTARTGVTRPTLIEKLAFLCVDIGRGKSSLFAHL